MEGQKRQAVTSFFVTKFWLRRDTQHDGNFQNETFSLVATFSFIVTSFLLINQARLFTPPTTLIYITS